MLPRIALHRVNVHLRGRHVLRDVSWSLEAGRHWAVVGPNGSGKSTFLRVLGGSGWIDADGGTRQYSPDGERVDPTTRATTWIRLVSPEAHERYARLDLGITGRELVTSGLDDSVYVARAPEAGASRRIDALLDDLDLAAFAGRPIRELSSGQLRRLLIARALVSEPRVLVLDEFTNGLDRPARRDVLDVLDQLAGRVALIVAAHRSSDLPAAITDTATLHDGRISETRAGRPEPHVSLIRAGSVPAPRDAADAVLLSIRHADVYRGRDLVLRNVDWTLRRGEHTLVRGANGAGKSTFAGLVAGTIPAAVGAEIVRFGQRGPFDIWKLKARVAHVSDDLQIAYDQSDVVESVVASGFAASIGLFNVPTPEQASAAQAALAKLGLSALRGRSFAQLSFGERRKVLIARSLVRRPDIFILDEVWNGLDIAFRAALHAQLTELMRAGTTIVAFAHDEDDDIVSLATRTNWIVDGTLRQSAPAAATGEIHPSFT